MPYFSWQGVTLIGERVKGKRYARTRQELDEQLLKREIALLKAVVYRSWYKRTPSKMVISALFKQLAALLSAGILLPEALTLVLQQGSYESLHELLSATVARVEQGIPLDKAMAEYPHIFSPFMLAMVHAGHESGSMAHALSRLGDYVKTAEQFRTQMRAALLMPLITGLFCLVVALLIFLIIIPRFAELFTTMQHQLPPITRFLMTVSSVITSWDGVAIVVVGLLLCGVIWWYSTRNTTQRVVDAFVLKIPGIGSLVQATATVCWLESLALTIQSGLPLIRGLAISSHAVKNRVLKAQLLFLEYEVKTGTQLSDAMMHHEYFFGPEVIALTRIGQESGMFGVMVEQAARDGHERIARRLQAIATFIQPLCIIVIGMCIGVLVYSIYTPIFTLGRAIG